MVTFNVQIDCSQLIEDKRHHEWCLHLHSQPESIQKLVDQSFSQFAELQQVPELQQINRSLVNTQVFGVANEPPLLINTDTELKDYLTSSELLHAFSSKPHFRLILSPETESSISNIEEEEVSQLRSFLGNKFQFIPARILLNSLKDLSDGLFSSITDAFNEVDESSIV